MCFLPRTCWSRCPHHRLCSTARVRQRGRHLEANVTLTQLATLATAFERAYRRWNRPLIRLDTTVFNTFDKQQLHELANHIRHLPILLESR